MLTLVRAELAPGDTTVALYTFESSAFQVRVTFVVEHDAKGDTLADNAEAARHKAISMASAIAENSRRRS